MATTGLMMQKEGGQWTPVPRVHSFKVHGRIDEAMVQHVRCQLENAPDVDVLEIDIASDGGEFEDVWELIGLIQAHGAKTVGLVQNKACSGGAFLFTACDERKMWREAVLMLHGPQPQNAEAAAEADHVARVMAAFAARRTGHSGFTGIDQVRAWFQADECWFTSGDAVRAGIATEIVPHEDRGARFVIPEGARRFSDTN